MTRVYWNECKNYTEKDLTRIMIEAFEYIGGLESIVKPGETVLLKLNLTGPFPPECAATTHPMIVKIVAKMVKKLKAFPIIADGPATIKSPLQETGIDNVALEEDLKAFLFEKFEKKKVDSFDIVAELMYSSDILKADKIISIPKLKTHALTMFTGAIKNMFGAVAFEQRKSLHKYKKIEDFSKILTDVYSVRVPDLTIMDGIWGMEGIGPVHGQPINLGLFIVSKDGVAVDALSTALLGYNVKDIIMINHAKAKGLGEADLNKMMFNNSFTEKILQKVNLIPVLNGQMRERFLKIVLGTIACQTDKCIKCQECQKGCPGEAITLNPYPLIDHKKCLNCYRCYEICYNGALQIITKKKE